MGVGEAFKILLNDPETIITTLAVIFVVVCATVISVAVAQNRILKQTKEEVSKGFDKLAKSLDNRRNGNG